jgi:hypothetical protein
VSVTLLVATVVTRAPPVAATVEVTTARADHAPEPERRELSDVTCDRAASRCDVTCDRTRGPVAVATTDVPEGLASEQDAAAAGAAWLRVSVVSARVIATAAAAERRTGGAGFVTTLSPRSSRAARSRTTVPASTGSDAGRRRGS